MDLKKLCLKISHIRRRKQYPGTATTEGPKQDEPKQTHLKTY